MGARKLQLKAENRVTLEAGNELAEHRGDEVLVGLDHAESIRLIAHRRHQGRRSREEKADRRNLEERHKRGMLFWSIATAVDDCINEEMTADQAFEIGRATWQANAGQDQLADFELMIAAVPMNLRMAALNGWLCAFDDEADRLKP